VLLVRVINNSTVDSESVFSVSVWMKTGLSKMRSLFNLCRMTWGFLDDRQVVFLDKWRIGCDPTSEVPIRVKDVTPQLVADAASASFQ
jgi:hypothetical protein